MLSNLRFWVIFKLFTRIRKKFNYKSMPVVIRLWRVMHRWSTFSTRKHHTISQKLILIWTNAICLRPSPNISQYNEKYVVRTSHTCSFLIIACHFSSTSDFAGCTLVLLFFQQLVAWSGERMATIQLFLKHH